MQFLSMSEDLTQFKKRQVMAQKTVEDVIAFINEGGDVAPTPIDGKREKKREKKRRKGKRKEERGEEKKASPGTSPGQGVGGSRDSWLSAKAEEEVEARNTVVSEKQSEEELELEEFRRRLERGEPRRKVRMKPNVSAAWVKSLRERYGNLKKSKSFDN